MLFIKLFAETYVIQDLYKQRFSINSVNYCLLYGLPTQPMCSDIYISSVITSQQTEGCQNVRFSLTQDQFNVSVLNIFGDIKVQSVVQTSITLFAPSIQPISIQSLNLNISVTSPFDFSLVRTNTSLNVSNSLLNVVQSSLSQNSSLIQIYLSNQTARFVQTQLSGQIQMQNAFFGGFFVNASTSIVNILNCYTELIFSSTNAFAFGDFFYVENSTVNQNTVLNNTGDFQRLNNSANGICYTQVDSRGGNALYNTLTTTASTKYYLPVDQLLFCIQCNTNHSGTKCKTCTNNTQYMDGKCRVPDPIQTGSSQCYIDEIINDRICISCNVGYKLFQCISCADTHINLDGICRPRCATCSGQCYNDPSLMTPIKCLMCDSGFDINTFCQQCLPSFTLMYGVCVLKKICTYTDYLSQTLSTTGGYYIQYYLETDTSCTESYIQNIVINADLNAVFSSFSLLGPNTDNTKLKGKFISGNVTISGTVNTVYVSGLLYRESKAIIISAVEVNLKVTCNSKQAFIAGLVSQTDFYNNYYQISQVTITVTVATNNNNPVSLGGVFSRISYTGVQVQNHLINSTSVVLVINNIAPTSNVGGIVALSNLSSINLNASKCSISTSLQLQQGGFTGNYLSGILQINASNITSSLTLGGGLFYYVLNSTIQVSSVNIILTQNQNYGGFNLIENSTITITNLVYNLKPTLTLGKMSNGQISWANINIQGPYVQCISTKCTVNSADISGTV
ncbi:Hypothetical_protein [Hexamita inflata]|uniref:Hypothetical_protein n=1 Tax=Hexamita inflata TaxID=28002 RepID=A0ABP1HP51_9EUKA